MQINASVDKNLAKVVEKVAKPLTSRSYEFCIKADAMRFAKMYKESVQVYLQAILADRKETKAYWGLAISYKYLKIIQKLLKLYQNLF